MDKTTMSSFRRGEPLSYRLQKIRSYYDQEKNVWDIGCDHGLLGLSFKDTESVETLNLVDPSAPVIDVLNKKLIDSYISKAKVYHSEGQKLTLSSSSNCIFIAGMGGKEIGEIVSHLLPQLDSSSKIVISPHRKIIELRQLLHSLPLSLRSEEVIFEDDQYYQILSLSPVPGTPVPLYGDSLWQSEAGEKYLEHQLRYFKLHRDEASLAYMSFLERLNPLKTRNSL